MSDIAGIDTGEIDKFAYKSQYKRWEVSADPLSRKRLEGVLDIKHELEEGLPGIHVGMSGFGSLFSGKELEPETALASDIDVAVVIDKSDIVNKFTSWINQNEVLRTDYLDRVSRWDDIGYSDPQEQARAREWARDWTTELYIEKTVKEKLAAATNQDIRSYDPQSVNQVLLMTSLGENGTMMHCLGGLETAQRSMLMTNVEAKKDEVRKNYQDWQSRMGLYWGLDVGGGMRYFRQDFLNQLAQGRPKRREAAWELVRAASGFLERNGQIPEGIERQYPQDFAAACKAYGVTLS